jgi:hypothetical protein
MITDRIRGGAGIVFAILGLLLLRGGSGFSESLAATGCLDDPTCYAETKEEGTIGPQGIFVASYTVTCKGDCGGGLGQKCEPNNKENPTGEKTFQCSCDPNSSPASCSGVVTVDKDGNLESFSCMGDCGIQSCKNTAFNKVIDHTTCPAGYSMNQKCVCE